jgi:hypothetical protein
VHAEVVHFQLQAHADVKLRELRRSLKARDARDSEAVEKYVF